MNSVLRESAAASASLCSSIPARGAAYDACSRSHLRSARRSRWGGGASSGKQMRHADVALVSNRRPSVALGGTRGSSLALDGPRWHSRVLIGTGWPSVALEGSHWHWMALGSALEARSAVVRLGEAQENGRAEDELVLSVEEEGHSRELTVLRRGEQHLQHERRGGKRPRGGGSRRRRGRGGSRPQAVRPTSDRPRPCVLRSAQDLPRIYRGRPPCLSRGLPPCLEQRTPARQ